ncbi:lipopolysaccharide biosynthesis protein [Natroniella sulfidigena]|uniref:lipopolysaccharide biosynthesis protein n=1 Tax=Natroniella sulfidigena TaxID=723921 RepID=UPI00200B108C|nr:lipopolysaccharide biosynthesis protein [Natroniella sulfidigena]MCK8816308.1 lipopolysaccharide biosynthesis protein [Natroniella sulfidigena]
MNNNKNSQSDKKSLTHSTLDGLLWMVSGAGVKKIFKFLVTVVLARLLTPEDFGLVGIAGVVIGFSKIFYQIGIGPALVQRSEVTEKHLRTGFIFSFILSLLISGIIVISAPLIAQFFQEERLISILRILSISFIIRSFSVVSSSLLNRRLKFDRLAQIDAIAYAIGYCLVGVVLGLLDFGVWALVGADLAKTSLKVLLLFMSVPYSLIPKFNFKALKDLLYFGTGFTLGRVFEYFALKGDYFVIGRLLGSGALGLYERAYQLMASGAEAFAQVLNRILFPTMSKLKDDPKRLLLVYRRTVALVSLFVLPISLVMFVLAPEIIRVVLGENWSGAIIPFRFFSIGMLFRTSYRLSYSLAQAAGAVYGKAFRQAVYGILIVVGTFIGHYWGINGVAFGVVIALFINFMYMAQLSLKLVDIDWNTFFRIHFPGVKLAIFVGVESWFLVLLFRSILSFDLGVILSVGIVVMLSILLLIKFTSNYILGEDGLWLIKTLGDYLPDKFIIANKVLKSIT